MTDPAETFAAIRDAVGTVLVGNEDVVEGLGAALLARGHVLLEGVPGVGKTTVARLFARATGLEYARVQMTPDMLPADVTGTRVYREDGEFAVERGPVFANVVVADEINRATPKTQSALLEAMQERSVTLQGETLALPEPFAVVATRNPIEMEGTYPLPEAQRDRFALKLTVDLPDADEERAILDRFDEAPDLAPSAVDPVVDRDAVLAAREAAASVHVADGVKEYVRRVAAATREHAAVAHGASPRAALHLMDCAKARAAIRGREYVVPDDAKALAGPALAHRLVLGADAELDGTDPADVVDDVVSSVPVPAGVDDAPVDDSETAADGGDGAT